MKNQQAFDHLTPTLRNEIARECCRVGQFHVALATELVETLVHDQVGSFNPSRDVDEALLLQVELGFLSDADLASQVLELCEVGA